MHTEIHVIAQVFLVTWDSNDRPIYNRTKITTSRKGLIAYLARNARQGGF